MIPEEIARRERLQSLRDNGVNPYPTTADQTHSLKDALAQFDALEQNDDPISVRGRVRAIRKHGGVTFIVLQDASGKMQMVLHRDTVGTESYTFFHDHADVGDFYQFSGTAFRTKKGEPSIGVQKLTLLTKSLLPLPEKWHGLTDTETRFRKRYLDLIVNGPSMEFALARARMVAALRRFMEKDGFMEVETPILQPIAGGAAARPFTTHHNTLHHDFYLRIAPELYLKRLLVGGFEKVYEFARCFRNEGISPQHNPEFTQIEAYWSYAEIDDLLDHFERMFAEVIPAVTGSMKVTHSDVELDFSKIARLTFHDAILRETKIDIDEFASEEDLRAAIEKIGVNTKDVIGESELLDTLWKQKVRPMLVQPTFILDYPAVMKPLAKVRPDNPKYSAGAQLVVKGVELINAFNEQNDPIEQEEVFKEQEALREQGSEEAQMVDYNYLDALKHGMPPAAGYGIGIDRLAMLLTGAENIKEVILFPTLKPKVQEDTEETDSEEKDV